MELYFAFYSAILLLWPFEDGSRYLFPISPIALLHAWRGVRWCARQTERYPFEFRISVAIAAGVLFVISIAANLQSGLRNSLQGVFASFFWFSLCLLIGMVNSWNRWMQQTMNFLPAQHAGILILVIVVACGLFQQGTLAMRLREQDPSVSVLNFPSPDSKSQYKIVNWLRTVPGGDPELRARKVLTFYRESRLCSLMDGQFRMKWVFP